MSWPPTLTWSEEPTPEPGDGQVLVEVVAAGVNFIDVYHREGRYPVATPFVPGGEGAGVITALGPGVTDLAVGDHVAWKASASGSYSTHAVVAVDEAVRVPSGLDDEVAAAVMLQGLTAHYLATSTYPIQHGDTVVVHAAAGGVGLLLTQIAKRLGAVVIGTASTSEKAEAARAAGADEVVGYDELVGAVQRRTDGQGVPVVYDGVGAATFDDSLKALRVRGTLVLFGAASGAVPPFDLQRLNSGGSLYVTRPTLLHYTRDREELMWRADEVLGWVADGSLKVTIGGRYPLADAAQAHDDLEGRRTSGKLLLIA